MKKLLLGAFAMAMLAGCAKDPLHNETIQELRGPIAKTEIDETLYEAIEKDGTYNWAQSSTEMLWSAGMQSDSVFAIGYQLDGMNNVPEIIHQIDIESGEWKAVQTKILNIILEGELANRPDLRVESLLPFGYPDLLPTLAVQITNIETIEKLRVMPELRYLEPMGYELAPLNNTISTRSSSGCGIDPNYNINSNDYTTIAPNAKQSWHHATSNVSTAWAANTGSGVTVAVIDTGASYDQDNLGSQFNSGYSSGRTVEKVSTLYTGMWWWKSLTSPDDDCGHGTQMSGLATAPRSNDGNAVGVAYNANLLAIKAVEDVIISTSNERNGVKEALKLAGNRSDVKVISMSIGSPFWSGTVADGVYYAHNKGKTIMAAAGTSLTWTTWYGVIFPATMSQTTAVTGVRDNIYNMQKCNTCHSGGAVDFVMVMQRASNTDRTAITLAPYSNQPSYVGGSSAATASVAGIAALIYANSPGATRSEVFNAMKQNASFYPNDDDDFGWGIIDAGAAVNTPL